MLCSLRHHFSQRFCLSDKTFGLFIVVITFLYHAIVGIQGFDMYDEGWSLTGFQQIFNAPESVEYLFLYYLTNIIGGLWNICFGFGGIYSFRILASIVISLTAYVVWLMLRDHINRWYILGGLLMAYFSSYYGIMVFYHNYLTTLLTVCSMLFLYKALTLDSSQCAFLSGLVIGINIFVRLPNIVLLALVLLLIPYYLHTHHREKTTTLFISVAVGVVLGILFVLGLMVALGHLEIFISAIQGGFSASDDAESTHNLGTMVTRYLSVYAIIFTQGILNNTYTIYLIATITCCWIIFSRRYPISTVYLACLSLLYLHLLPLGSDYGIQNMGENCLFLAAPFTLGFIAKALKNITVAPYLKTLSEVILWLFVALFMVRGGKHIMMECYFDEGNRLEKTYKPDTPLATTYTTKENCKELNTIMEELSHYVKPGDELLCFQNMPMLHFLTQTQPYLKNPWVWSYDPSNMQLHFQKAEKAGKKLPVLVREKTMIAYWTKPYPNWDNPHAENSYLHKNKKIALIQQFILTHHYHVVWENDICQILLPDHNT